MEKFGVLMPGNEKVIGPFYTVGAANDFVVANEMGMVLPIEPPPEQAGPREAAARIVSQSTSDIQATKQLRQEFSLGLKEAKDLIDEARRSQAAQ